MKKALLLASILAALMAGAITFSASDSEHGKLPIGYVDEQVSVNGLALRVRGFKPSHLKVSNVPRLATQEDIDLYVAKRRQDLTQLAQQSPDREVEVLISPSRKLFLEDFAEQVSEHRLALDALSLDLFIGEQWSHTVSFDRHTKMVDITADPKAIAERVIEIESLAPRPHPKPGVASVPAVDPENSKVAIRFVRGRLSTQAAATLQQDPAILLVDPITDIKDLFRDDARKVTVTEMPQLYVEQAALLRSNQHRERD